MKKGFTLLEILVVVLIIGILAAVGLPSYEKAKVSALEKESQINLKLIRAAEKIYHMENASYYPSSGSQSTLATINDNLKLSLPAQNWNYKIDGGTSSFTAKARRIADTTNVWCIDQATEDPYSSGCSW